MKGKATENWRKMHNEELRNLYLQQLLQNELIREHEMVSEWDKWEVQKTF
jgi:hypothetical protein